MVSHFLLVFSAFVENLERSVQAAYGIFNRVTGCVRREAMCITWRVFRAPSALVSCQREKNSPFKIREFTVKFITSSCWRPACSVPVVMVGGEMTLLKLSSSLS